MQGDFSYVRYLESKRSVDDRAINRVVLDALRERLPTGRPLRILEIGGGTGSMVRRCLRWSLLEDAQYHLVDEDAESIAKLPALFATWAETQSNTACESQGPRHLRLSSQSASIHLHLEEAEVSEYLSKCEESFDLVIANAVLDLVDLPTLLPKLWSRCASDALYWFTINFDGESVFLPALANDGAIFEAYHASMDRRTGTRYTGRRLFADLENSGATIVESGSSDWVVHPRGQSYREDEAYFLHHIVHTVDQELEGTGLLPGDDFQTWVRERHQQIEKGSLVYVAHQLDFVGHSAQSKGSL